MHRLYIKTNKRGVNAVIIHEVMTKVNVTVPLLYNTFAQRNLDINFAVKPAVNEYTYSSLFSGKVNLFQHDVSLDTVQMFIFCNYLNLRSHLLKDMESILKR